MTTEREHELLTEIAALQLELLRLTQCDINMKFLLDCLEKAEYELPDYTLGTWQERAKGLAPAVTRLKDQLGTLEEALKKIRDMTEHWGSPDEVFEMDLEDLQDDAVDGREAGRVIYAIAISVLGEK